MKLIQAHVLWLAQVHFTVLAQVASVSDFVSDKAWLFWRVRKVSKTHIVSAPGTMISLSKWSSCFSANVTFGKKWSLETMMVLRASSLGPNSEGWFLNVTETLCERSHDVTHFLLTGITTHVVPVTQVVYVWFLLYSAISDPCRWSQMQLMEVGHIGPVVSWAQTLIWGTLSQVVGLASIPD